MGGIAYQWLGGVGMHMYAKCDKLYHVIQEL